MLFFTYTIDENHINFGQTACEMEVILKQVKQNFS